MTRLTGRVEKGWGSEEIWATNDRYCGKLMRFNTGARFSMHFHAEKDESWYVLDGLFKVMYLLKQKMPANMKPYSNQAPPGATVHYNHIS
jgi:mannose-6-phosphate isomerase-like protein (cupin superfamily)